MTIATQVDRAHITVKLHAMMRGENNAAAALSMFQYHRLH
jgi:hypothetical protein